MLLVWLLALGLQDDPLAVARKDMDELKFDHALETIEQAVKSGGNDPARLAELLRMSGEAAAAIGRTDEARASFERLLAIAPDTHLAEGTSPKIARPFEDARQALRGAALRVHHEARPSEITLIVDADPQKMVAGARARFRSPSGAEQVIEGRGSGRVTLELPAVGRIEVVLSAIDAQGNRLTDTPVVVEGAVAVPQPIDNGSQPAARPLYARWWPWAAAAVAVAGVGIAFGLASSSAQDDLKKLNANSAGHDFTEARSLEDDANRNALLANISFGVAGAAAVVSAVMFWRERADQPEPRATVLPTLGGALVRVRF